MKLIEQHIAMRESAWRRNRFFRILADQPDTAFLRDFARRLTFWPLAFQDVLRVLSETVRETSLNVIARHHAAEDRDHDLWFLHDLRALGARLPDANELFRADHEPARRAAYAIVAQTLAARTGAERIVVLLALESTGHVFFTETSRFVRAVGCEGLAYFSEDHLAVEKGHALFEERAKEILRSIRFDHAERRRAIAVAHACFDAIETMFERILVSLPSGYFAGGAAGGAGAVVVDGAGAVAAGAAAGAGA
jgi:hypothetical protein